MNLPSPPPRLSRVYSLFVSHAWNYKDEYGRLIGLLNADSTFRWENLSVPIDNPLPLLPTLPRSYRFLVRQLDDRISKSDCLLVLAGMYVAHSGWIQSEIEAAKEYGKPIIAVEPRGQERFPEAVRQAADESVGWTSSSIVAAVRRVLRPRLIDEIRASGLLSSVPTPKPSLADLLIARKSNRF
jgi:predicted DNA-binding transcriptional regulator AlpA